MTEPITRTVAPAEAGMRLDVFLANQPEVGGRGLAKQLIEAGLVEVPGERVRPGLFVAPGSAVSFRVALRAPTDPLAPDLPLPLVPVLYEDAWLCAIDKPAGLAAHPPADKGFCEHTVASWAKARYGELPSVDDAERPGIVHRLDRDTSGVMVLAKTEPALEFLRAHGREGVPLHRLR